MPQPPISDPKTLADVTSLNTAATGAIGAWKAVSAEADGHRDRLARLKSRLEAEIAAEPPAAVGDVAALAGEIAADPTADASAAIAVKVRESREAVAVRHEEWATSVAVTRAAIVKVEAEVGAAEEAQQATFAEASRAWGAFLSGARDAMLGELRTGLRDLHDRVHGPLQAIYEARALSGAGKAVPSWPPGTTHVLPDSRVMLRRVRVPAPPFGPNFDDERLFPLPVEDPAAVLADFRQSLAAPKRR